MKKPKLSKKKQKALEIACYRHAFNVLGEIALECWRKSVELEGGIKNVRVRKDGKIVVDTSKLKKGKKK